MWENNHGNIQSVDEGEFEEMVTAGPEEKFWFAWGRCILGRVKGQIRYSIKIPSGIFHFSLVKIAIILCYGLPRWH